MSQRFHFGGLSLVPFDLETAAEWIVDRAVEEHACIVITSNIAHLPLIRRDRAFLDVVSKAELNVADGWPLVLASELLRTQRLPGRVAGVDLVATVLRSERRLRVAILGGPPGSAELLAGRIERSHDVVAIEPLAAGTWESPEALDALSDRLSRRRPNLVLVAIGDPQQALLAERLLPVVSGPLICCGAAVEILAGLRRRAPRPIQALGLEWAFRAALEPKRLLPRYARSVPVYLRALARGLRDKRSVTHDPPPRAGAP
jgi:N-acetylglucosaminyldiphosphoundecaprenol N-acetyl-beta-D-mannosaminyltransferase